MDWNATTSSANATSCGNLDMRGMAQALHDDLSQAHHDRESLQEQLAERVEKHSEILMENKQLHKRIATLQQQMTFAIEAQTRLETDYYAREQDLEEFKKTVAQLTREKKEVIKQLESEQETFEYQQQRWLQKEESLNKQIRKLSSQATTTAASCKRRLPTSPKSSPSEYDNKKMSPSPRQQRVVSPAAEKTITKLKSQLANLEKQYADQHQYQLACINHLEEQLASARQMNESLMEDNESYQLLLHEKTMNGEILAASRATMDTESSDTRGINLADELGNANYIQEQESSLYDEVRSLKDTNRALQLYLNKILMKIIDNESMQHVLSVDDIPATSNIHPPKQHDITIQPQSSTSTIPKVMRSSFSTGLLSKFLSKRLPLSQQTRDININVTEEAIPVNTVDDGKDVSCTR
ncbi:hypothetical protein O0I10_005422 [Lichtheimia ornata]|uniref:Uncharacterized protein n=1 Tax=Lichtheimia ornata TaxID=688661 RepID=A0AAD7XVM3_9FUNG|nr:uncharacterized protein O0I10_005422 [Lichtheimia ornata]KAJ8658699.1 hypothetical protein O0I10_005422 [Lichtheimia ornata]